MSVASWWCYGDGADCHRRLLGYGTRGPAICFGGGRRLQARHKPGKSHNRWRLCLVFLYCSSILPLVLGVFSGATLRLAAAGPPSFCPALTAQAEPLLKQNRIPISTGCRSPCAPSAGIPDEMCDMREVSRSSCRVEVHDGRPGWAGQVC